MACLMSPTKTVCSSALVALIVWSSADALAAPVSSAAPYTVAGPRTPAQLPAPTVRPQYLLLVSIDGVGYEAFRRHRRALPVLSRLARRGALRPMHTTFPSMTWVAHTSLITGQLPRHHGIVGNRWMEADGTFRRPAAAWDTDRWRRARVPNLPELAQRAGLSVATLNWPATQGSRAMRWNLPEIMGRRGLYKLSSMPMRRLIDRYLQRGAKPGRDPRYRRNLLDRIALREGIEYDWLLRDLAVELVAPRGGKTREPPRVMLLHFLLPDSWMHRYGSSRLIERWALQQSDRAVGRVLAAYRRAKILAETAVVVVSDHGFVEITHTMNLRRLLKEAGYAKYLYYTRGRCKRDELVSILNGHVVFIYARSDRVRRALPEIAALIGKHNACIERVLRPPAYKRLGLPVPAAGGKETAPDQHLGAPDLLVLSKPHCIFRGGPKRRPIVYKLKRGIFGYHGYTPRYGPLRALLITAGAGFGKRVLSTKAVEITDIAPTLAHLFGLRWPKGFPAHPQHRFTLDGRVLRELLAP